MPAPTSIHVPLLVLFLLHLAQFVAAGEGGVVTGPSSSPQSANYHCDPTTCTGTCRCASVSPPGGLTPQQTPQFITYTNDDAVQLYTVSAVHSILGNRSNPNGCPVKSTWFVALNYTDYSLVTDYLVAGNEIADHTMTHVGTPSPSEIQGNLKALNAFAGIPLSSISGFRAPFLNYTKDTLTQLSTDGFTYDSSGTSASLANSTNTDAFWPYTLDNGFANDCLNQPALCVGLQLPGFWEIPMYATFSNDSTSASIHLMDVWMDSDDQAAVLEWLKFTFLTHYEGNRQPFGIYSHPIHYATSVPGVTDPTNIVATINTFLDWAQQHQDVWMVTNSQLIEWVKNPVPISQIADASYLHCSTPAVNPSLKVCNGIPANEAGLQVNCNFVDFPWKTCYGCPVSQPNPNNPVPAQNTALGTRFHLSATCAPAFFNPVTNTCLCSGNSSSCAFTDQTRPLGNYSGTPSDSSSLSTLSATGSAPTTESAPHSSATRTYSNLFGCLLLTMIVGFIAVV